MRYDWNCKGGSLFHSGLGVETFADKSLDSFWVEYTLETWYGYWVPSELSLGLSFASCICAIYSSMNIRQLKCHYIIARSLVKRSITQCLPGCNERLI